MFFVRFIILLVLLIWKLRSIIFGHILQLFSTFSVDYCEFGSIKNYAHRHQKEEKRGSTVHAVVTTLLVNLILQASTNNRLIKDYYCAINGAIHRGHNRQCEIMPTSAG